MMGDDRKSMNIVSMDCLTIRFKEKRKWGEKWLVVSRRKKLISMVTGFFIVKGTAKGGMNDRSDHR